MNARGEDRGPLAALLAALLVALAAGALAACGSTEEGEPELTVYVSVPLAGPLASAGRDAADGARLALDDAGGEAGGVRVRARYLDRTGAGARAQRWSPAGAAANARVASRDSTAIAYVGELESSATRFSLPITNEAGILQVAPASGAEYLVRDAPGGNRIPTEVQPSGTRTFGRISGADSAAGATSQLDRRAVAAARRLSRRLRLAFGRRGGPYTAYGYEAMAVVLDAIDRAEDPLDRLSVVDAFFATTDRESILGRYSIDEVGASTLDR